jgi:hypothetical protein
MTVALPPCVVPGLCPRRQPQHVLALEEIQKQFMTGGWLAAPWCCAADRSRLRRAVHVLFHAVLPPLHPNPPHPPLFPPMPPSWPCVAEFDYVAEVRLRGREAG